jgi:hypothetical protein
VAQALTVYNPLELKLRQMGRLVRAETFVVSQISLVTLWLQPYGQLKVERARSLIGRLRR